MAHSYIQKKSWKGWALRMYKKFLQTVVLPQPILLGAKIMTIRFWLQKTPWSTLKNSADEDIHICCIKKEDNFCVTKMGRQHKHMYFDHVRNMDGKGLETVSASERDHERPPPCRGWVARRWCVTDAQE